jgi:hypothetical protein
MIKKHKYLVASLVVSFTISGAVAVFIGYAALDHNPQGEFAIVDPATGATLIDWPHLLGLCGSWFLPTFVFLLLLAFVIYSIFQGGRYLLGRKSF